MLICSKDEMAEIRRGAIKPDQLIVNKNNKFTETIDNLIDSRTLQTIRAGWFPRLKLSFYYTGVRFNEKMPEVIKKKLVQLCIKSYTVRILKNVE